MAEVVGAVASVLTLCQVVSGGLNTAIKIYKAPEEIKSLQEQVEDFHGIVQATQKILDGSPASVVLQRAVLRAQRVIEDLRQLIDVKLIRQVNGCERARRRAWARYKHKIVLLRDNLKEARQNLCEAIMVNNLLTSQSINTSIAKPKQAITRTLVTLTDHRSKSHLSEQVRCPFEPTASTRVQASANADLSIVRSSAQKPLTYRYDAPLEPPPTCRQAPNSMFERLTSFRPEMYSTSDPIPTVWTYFSHEISTTAYDRVYQFGLFFCRAPSQWTRITLRLSVDVGSKYWDLEKMHTYSLVAIHESHNLPLSLLFKFQKFLQANPDFEQDSHLEGHIGSNAETEKFWWVSRLATKHTLPNNEPYLYLREITNMTYHLNCPRYCDRALTHRRPLGKRRTTDMFIAYLQNRWVLEVRFGSHQSQIESNLYIMKALHILKGSPGINDFVGTVFDEESGVISAFLSEIPAKGMLVQIIDEANQRGQKISWQRREKWCKQIVEGVAAMHSKGIVSGYFQEDVNAGVAIDGEDNAVLIGRFRTAFPRYSDKVGTLPPEFRQIAKSQNSFEVNPCVDMFHLGRLLWRIAAQTNILNRHHLCQLAGCFCPFDTICTEPHADPVELPSPGPDVPLHFFKIINACRAANPEDRISAWELLEMFSADGECEGNSTGLTGASKVVDSTPEQSTSCSIETILKPSSLLQIEHQPGKRYLTRPEDCLAMYGPTFSCSICTGPANPPCYHCDICQNADFDLCPSCFNDGLHCFNNNHRLREYLDGQLEDKFYSSVRLNGRREVTVL